MMDKMEKIKDICEIKENLMSWFKNNTRNGSCIEDMEDVEVMEKVSDMIKDFAEAEEKCIKTLYYKTVIEAMERGEEREDHEGRFEYNSNRHADGTYAPSGYGNRTGRSGMTMPHYDHNGGKYGYNGNGSIHNGGYESSSNSNGGRLGYSSMWDGMPEEYDPRYGEAYNKYQMAKRHYTETKSETDKNEMESHAKNHMKDLVETVKEIYKNAPAQMKTELKNDIVKLTNEMV